MGTKRGLSVGCGFCIVILGVLLANHAAWFWLVFAGDYFLGNPSFFRAYRDNLLDEEYHLYPVKHYMTPTNVPEINASDYTFEGFIAASNNWKSPVVFRGLFKEAALMKWTPQSLITFFSQQPNRTFLITKKNDFHAKLPPRQMITDSVDNEWMPLEQYVENVTNGGTTYLHNANLIFPEDMPLYKDMELDRSKFDRYPMLAQFFLGKKRPGEVRGSGSPLHCAAAPNLFIQISSSKKWTTIDAKWTRFIWPNMFSFQLAAHSKAAIVHEPHKAIGRFGNFPRAEVTVHPGDGLWVPGWMWHEVENVPSDDWSLAVATRYSVYWQLMDQNWIFSLLADFGTSGRPCLRGLRLICFALYPGVHKSQGPMIPNQLDFAKGIVKQAERSVE